MSTHEQTNFFANVLLENVGMNSASLPDIKLTGFMACKGKDYTGELMVVGRAVNGWDSEFRLNELMNPRNCLEHANLIRKTVELEESNGCPMQWVTDSWGDESQYNTKRSAFWRVIYNVMLGLSIVRPEETNWSTKLVWSNLYKVSPKDGGNPSNKLCSIQFMDCKKLLAVELETFKPKRVLFLTGKDWFEGFLELNEMHTIADYKYIESFGTYNSSKCVVAAHPQGKNEVLWVKEVIAIFDDIDNRA